ncbi:hypothetical protein J6590_073271 [Homalodisca vitripennis]|nr:hypothetical protein J6590_073271 [Homalodisca vitripennis]
MKQARRPHSQVQTRTDSWSHAEKQPQLGCRFIYWGRKLPVVCHMCRVGYSHDIQPSTGCGRMVSSLKWK